MDTRKIGSLEVTVVGLGTNNFGYGMAEEDVAPVVDAALDAGVNFFDTADSYGASEERLGRALGKRRDRVVIATKFGSPVGKETQGGARPEYVRQAAERSLRMLGTDWIDLYQLHRPDPDTPIGDTLAALGELVAEGKVREIGCSNFSASQLREAEGAVAGGAPRFVSLQNAYSLLDRRDEQEVLPECRRLGLAYLPYFPLASGMLTGKYRRGEAPPEGTRLARWGDRASGMLSERNFDVVGSLTEWAEARGHTVLELATAWLIAQPVVASVIAGATKPDQVRANAASAAWRLTPDEAADVARLTE
ncbi:MAG TPA: aldo/keto reductase [Acidimicrobiales bacterium]|nr:aldo/keto reductase [Acidimicrobiales bacterium]